MKGMYLIILLVTPSLFSSELLQQFKQIKEDSATIFTAVKTVMERTSNLHEAIKEDRPVDQLDILTSVEDQINKQDSNGHTPLHLAARQGKIEYIQWLLSRNGRLDLADKEGQLALHLAIKKNRKAAAKELIRAIKNSSLTKLFNHPDKKGRTPLHLTVIYDDQLDLMKELILTGTPIDTQDADGNTILHHVMIKNVWKLFEELKLYVPKLINVANKDGETPLHLAAGFAHEDIVTYVLGIGDIEICTNKQCTPIFYAVQQKRKDITEAFIKKGAFTRRVDSDLQSLLCIAIANKDTGDMLTLLLKNELPTEATPVVRALETRNSAALEQLCKLNVDKNRVYQGGKSALHIAVELRYVDAIIKLLTYGAAIDSKDEFESTPLAYAVKAGAEDIVDLLLNPKAHPLLKEQKGVVGAQPLLKDIAGMDCIFYAVKQGKLSIVPKLIAHHPQIGSWNLLHGATLLHVAALYGHVQVIDYLLTKGIFISKIDGNAETALHFAVLGMKDTASEKKKYALVIQTLIDKKIDASLKNKAGLTAQELAQKLGLTITF